MANMFRLHCNTKGVTFTNSMNILNAVLYLGFFPLPLAKLAAMAAWSVDDFLKEIEDMEALQKLRPNALALPKLLETLEHKIKAIDSLTPSLLLKLTEKLEASSLPTDLKSSLQEAVDQKAVDASAGALKLQAGCQILVSLWNYLSSKEWQMVQSAPYVEAVHVCVSRLRAVGVKSMKEQTKKHALSLLLHLMIQRGEPKPPPMEVYKLGNYLHDCFVSSKQPSLVAGFLRYPEKPTDLGDAFMKACYKEGDYPQPVSSLVAPSVGALLKDAIVRNTHGDLQDNSLALPSKRYKRKTTLRTDDESEVGTFFRMMQMMKEMAKGMDEPKIDILTRRRSTSSSGSSEAPERLALADLPQEAVEASQAQPSAASLAAETLTAATIPAQTLDKRTENAEPDNTGAAASGESQEPESLEDFENRAFKQLQARNKRQKALKQDTKVMKRPSAAKKACVPPKKTLGPSALKRPAAAKAAPKAAAQPAEPKANCWGCSRCRGTPSGCEKCDFPEYKGTRLNGKDAWRKWHAQNCKKQI